MLLGTYYSQNYASIIYQGLTYATIDQCSLALGTKVYNDNQWFTTKTYTLPSGQQSSVHGAGCTVKK